MHAALTSKNGTTSICLHWDKGRAPNLSKKLSQLRQLWRKGGPVLSRWTWYPPVFQKIALDAFIPMNLMKTASALQLASFATLRNMRTRPTSILLKLILLCQLIKTSLIISPTRKLNVIASKNLGNCSTWLDNKDHFSLMIQVQMFELQCEGGIGRWMYYIYTSTYHCSWWPLHWLELFSLVMLAPSVNWQWTRAWYHTHWFWSQWECPAFACTSYAFTRCFNLMAWDMSYFFLLTPSMHQ